MSVADSRFVRVARQLLTAAFLMAAVLFTIISNFFRPLAAFSRTLSQVLAVSLLACVLWCMILGPILLLATGRWKTFLGIVGVPFCLGVYLLWRPGCSGGGTPEGAAVSNLRTINTAEITYRDGMAGRFGSMNDLLKAGLLDSRFESTVHGYRFEITARDDDYVATATPASTENGRYGYYSTADYVVRYALTNSATCNPCFPAGQAGNPVQ